MCARAPWVLAYIVGLLFFDVNAHATDTGHTAAQDQRWQWTIHSASTSTVFEGIHFQITARTIPAGGGWGLDVQVEAASADGLEHGLEPSPLSFSGTWISSCRGNTCTGGGGFGEGRSICGHGDPFPLKVSPGNPARMRRTYGRGSDRVVLPGKALELRVRLFGMAGVDGKYRAPTLAVIRLDVPEQGAPRIGARPAGPARNRPTAATVL